MSIIDGLKEMASRAAGLLSAVEVLQARIEGMEKQFDRLYSAYERFVEGLKSEQSALRVEINRLTGLSQVSDQLLTRLRDENTDLRRRVEGIESALERGVRRQAIELLSDLKVIEPRDDHLLVESKSTPTKSNAAPSPRRKRAALASKDAAADAPRNVTP